nr:hypothetical protein [Enterococcus sp. 4G2_DIV0659]
MSNQLEEVAHHLEAELHETDTQLMHEIRKENNANYREKEERIKNTNRLPTKETKIRTVQSTVPRTKQLFKNR